MVFQATGRARWFYSVESETGKAPSGALGEGQKCRFVRETLV